MVFKVKKRIECEWIEYERTVDMKTVSLIYLVLSNVGTSRAIIR